MVVNVIIFFLVFFWAGPVGLLSSFLNLASLDKLFPGIRKVADKNPLFKSLIQGFLPTVGVIIFLAIVPRILLSLCRRQGTQTHSDIARILYSKYFTFILFNVFLVFTIAGTWAQAFNKVYHNLGELSLLLAASLPRVAPFFVNFTILRGIGLLPLQLLQISNVFLHSFQNFIAKTPRDYALARSPPELSYGVVYANSTLIFVIIMIYSCVRPVILVFGAIYFAIGYLTYKYQLLYVYFHPYESYGRIWPVIYNRLTLGLLIFQTTMLGLFMLKHAYYLGILLAPLPVGTVWFWYKTINTYKRTAKYVPLELLRPEHALEMDSSLEHLSQHHQLFANSLLPPGSGSEVVPPSQRLGHRTVNVGMKSNKSATNGLWGNGIGAAVMTTTAIAGAVALSRGSKPKGAERSMTENAYQAMPDRHTDYSQPPMTLYPGVLNSGVRHYCHPAIAGTLPTLWLPLKKDNVGDNDGGTSDAGDEDSELPMNYDEGDNLAGGGQDEDDDDENAISSTGEPGAQGGRRGESSNIAGGPAVEGVYYHHPERRNTNSASGKPSVHSANGSRP